LASLVNYVNFGAEGVIIGTGRLRQLPPSEGRG